MHIYLHGTEKYAEIQLSNSYYIKISLKPLHIMKKPSVLNCENAFHKLIYGGLMGSPLSPIIADLGLMQREISIIL